MRVAVEDRVAVSADVTAAQIEAYLRGTGWTDMRTPGGRWHEYMLGDGEIFAEVPLVESASDWAECAARLLIELAEHEKRQPGNVLVDIVGHPVGLDVGSAANRLNTAMARLVDAQERLADAETAMRAKPKNETRQARVAAARGDVEQKRANVERWTKAPENAKRSDTGST